MVAGHAHAPGFACPGLYYSHALWPRTLLHRFAGSVTRPRAHFHVYHCWGMCPGHRSCHLFFLVVRQFFFTAKRSALLGIEHDGILVALDKSRVLADKTQQGLVGTCVDVPGLCAGMLLCLQFFAERLRPDPGCDCSALSWAQPFCRALAPAVDSRAAPGPRTPCNWCIEWPYQEIHLSMCKRT